MRELDSDQHQVACQFPQLLRRFRLAAGLTQDELAERAGLSVRGVSDLERGVRRFPYSDTLTRLADALQLGKEERERLNSARRDALRHQADLYTNPSSPVQTTSTPARATSGHKDHGRVDIHSRLPRRPTSFVGREREIAELESLLGITPVLTLVGPGGVGKTRLALEVAGGLAPGYADGVFLADLAPLSQPELVVQAVAQAFGLRTELDRQPQAAVLTFLSQRQALIVVDNCEHLVDACAELVGAVLQRCPRVRVLATSWEPLGIDGESLWRLGPLEEAAAVRLFVARARAQRADFDGGDVALVAQVCRAVDYLPLAIELAAARVALLEPHEILPRLENRFALLKRVGGHGGAPRQQTLRATVDWSYALLEPAERQLFRRLAVFAGPFDLAAVNAMGGPDSLDVLGRLVDKSLVVAQTARRGTRYRLLDTLRSYAWEQLRAACEEELARGQHLQHFLMRAEDLFTPSDSVDGRTCELDEDLDNLRSAFEWSLVASPEAGLRLIAATRDVWWRRSSAEGRRWAQAFLECCPEPSLARAQALQSAGMLHSLGDPARARCLLLEARELALRLDPATTAMVDYVLGFVAFVEEDAAEAVQHLEQALTTIHAVGEVRGGAILNVVLAWALLTDQARRDEARQRLEHAYQLGSDLGDRYTAGMADYGLGLYWRWTGQPMISLDHFRRALEALRGLEVAPGLSGTLLHIARLLAASEPARAGRLAGAGLAAAERVGVRLVPRLLQSIEQLRAELGQRLGADQARRAWAEGESLTMDEAIAMALEEAHAEGARPGA